MSSFALSTVPWSLPAARWADSPASAAAIAGYRRRNAATAKLGNRGHGMKDGSTPGRSNRVNRSAPFLECAARRRMTAAAVAGPVTKHGASSRGFRVFGRADHDLP